MIKVLLVDDDNMLRKLYGKRLEHAGYEIYQANNGVTGLEKAFEVLPDLILLDFHMPDLRGDEMLAILRTTSWGCDIPVIMMSAVTSLMHVPNIHQANEILYKPITGSELVQSVENTLQVPV